MFEKQKKLFYDNFNKIELSPGIEIPKKFISEVTGKEVNTTWIRNQRLGNRTASELELHRIYPEAVLEAQFIIRNRKLWNFLIDNIKIIDLPSERDRILHQTDFLIPQASLIIELDSHIFHDHRKIEDEIRDEYLRHEYGLTILRYNSFDFRNDLDRINYYKSVNRPLLLSYKDLSDQYYEYINKDFIEAYEYLLYNRVDWVCNRINGIIITKGDLNFYGWTKNFLSHFIHFCNENGDKQIYFLDKILIKSSELIQKYSTPSRKCDNIYNLLKQLGYL